MNPPRRLRGTFGMCNLREGFVNLREGFVVGPWRLREAFSKTRSAKASRRRHGRVHLETIRQIMTSPRKKMQEGSRFGTTVRNKIHAGWTPAGVEDFLGGIVWVVTRVV